MLLDRQSMKVSFLSICRGKGVSPDLPYVDLKHMGGNDKDWGCAKLKRCGIMSWLSLATANCYSRHRTVLALLLARAVKKENGHPLQDAYLYLFRRWRLHQLEADDDFMHGQLHERTVASEGASKSAKYAHAARLKKYASMCNHVRKERNEEF